MSYPPRKRLQFHLSTAMVITLVTSELIWVNSIQQRRDFSTYPAYGWPNKAVFKNEVLIPAGAHYMVFKHGNDIYILATRRMLINALVAFALLALIWFLCEWPLRRRAWTKSVSAPQKR